MPEAPAYDIGDLKQAQAARRAADRNATMGERLLRLHALCQQLGAIKGSAAGR